MAVRTRLHHGDLGLQEGTDDQVYQYLLMQANQVVCFYDFHEYSSHYFTVNSISYHFKRYI